MIVLFRFTERMIVHDSFSISGSNQGGVNAIWLQHCHRHVKNKKAIIWTNIRTTVTLTESEKVRKAKRSKKPGNKKWSDSLIWDTRPGHVCGTFFAFVAAQQFSQMSSCIAVTKIVAIAALLGWYTAIFVTKFKASPYLFTIARGRRLGSSWRRYYIARFRQTIMNYHGLFGRKHDSQW